MCDACDAETHVDESMRRHFRSHLRGAPTKCMECKEVTPNLLSLRLLLLLLLLLRFITIITILSSLVQANWRPLYYCHHYCDFQPPIAFSSIKFFFDNVLPRAVCVLFGTGCSWGLPLCGVGDSWGVPLCAVWHGLQLGSAPVHRCGCIIRV